MPENHIPHKNDLHLDLPVTQDHGQELDEARLDEVTGGSTNNRVYEMMSKIMANSHEMKKAIIANLPQ